MKLFKLTKSVNYVTYPVYSELVNISNSITDAMKTLKNLLLSLITGYVVNNSIIAKIIIAWLKGNFPKITEKLVEIFGDEIVSLLIYIIFSVMTYYIIKLACFLISMKKSNKNTDKKRAHIRYVFYDVSIPLLIEGKSIIEQYEDDKSDEKKKKLLLLLQAYNCIDELYEMLFSFKVIEKDKKGKQTLDSYEIYENIGKSAYDTVLAEMLDNICKLYGYFNDENKEKTIIERESLKSMLNSHGVFDEVESIQSELTEAKMKCNI